MEDILPTPVVTKNKLPAVQLSRDPSLSDSLYFDNSVKVISYCDKSMSELDAILYRPKIPAKTKNRVGNKPLPFAGAPPRSLKKQMSPKQVALSKSRSKSPPHEKEHKSPKNTAASKDADHTHILREDEAKNEDEDCTISNIQDTETAVQHVSNDEDLSKAGSAEGENGSSTDRNTKATENYMMRRIRSNEDVSKSRKVERRRTNSRDRIRTSGNEESKLENGTVRRVGSDPTLSRKVRTNRLRTLSPKADHGIMPRRHRSKESLSRSGQSPSPSQQFW
jgi:hypothetical protein